MISVVTGTLDRAELLVKLFYNVLANADNTELVLIDGGSTDDTKRVVIEAMARWPGRVKAIWVGARSPYAHYMNLGVHAASGSLICQWNDDALLLEPGWREIEKIVDAQKQFAVFPFSWALDDGTKKYEWQMLVYPEQREVVVNYGIYRREVFHKCGLYSMDYAYYCADGDMCYRAWRGGFQIYPMFEARVVTPKGLAKRARYTDRDMLIYEEHKAMYDKGIYPENMEWLK